MKGGALAGERRGRRGAGEGDVGAAWGGGVAWGRHALQTREVTGQGPSAPETRTPLVPGRGRQTLNPGVCRRG